VNDIKHESSKKSTYILLVNIVQGRMAERKAHSGFLEGLELDPHHQFVPWTLKLSHFSHIHEIKETSMDTFKHEILGKEVGARHLTLSL